MPLLRKPTRIFRATLSEKPDFITSPEDDDDGVRRVTLLVLEEPTIEIAIDRMPESIDARDSYWSSVPGGYPIPIELNPGQWIVGRAVNSIHELSVIVEYLP